jgi:pilus assembly protein Flp/PilA
MNKLFNSIRAFAIEEDGAQIIEYALIIAVVSIGLILLLQALKTGGFNGWIAAVNGCLSSFNCTAP